ncbi:MAG: hypothetical protein CMP23_14065 [Rickettsiales bacterium]|nr:hypothetical protein [Rickettsiales bacterium]
MGVGTSLPQRLQVELTNACSLSCASCARNEWDPIKNADAFMAEDTLHRLQPFFDAALEVSFGGYGDPTLSPLLAAAVSQASKAGAAVRVITGGAALSQALIKRLCEQGLDRLVLSMDGARDESLRRLRGLPLSAYLRWLRSFREHRSSSIRPLLQLNFVAQRSNIAELPELVELCAREDIAGLHVFHIQLYSNQGGKVSLLSCPELARPIFAQSAARAAELGIFLHLPRLDGEPRDCRQPFEQLFVRHDGRVRGCCSAVFDPGDYGLEVGDLSSAPRDLWRAPILERYRRAAAAGRPEALPKPCQSCSFRLPNLAAHQRPLTLLPERNAGANP